MFGTPGGDSGEFLLAFTIFHRYNDDLNFTTENSVLTLFRSYMDTLPIERGFFMHSDQHTMDKLANATQIPQFSIDSVPPAQQAFVLNFLVQPDYIGCGHLRMMALHSDQYETRLQDVQDFIRGFFDYRWNHPDWEKSRHETYVDLDGSHHEQAILEITHKNPGKIL